MSEESLVELRRTLMELTGGLRALRHDHQGSTKMAAAEIERTHVELDRIQAKLDDIVATLYGTSVTGGGLVERVNELMRNWATEYRWRWTVACVIIGIIVDRLFTQFVL